MSERTAWTSASQFVIMIALTPKVIIDQFGMV